MRADIHLPTYYREILRIFWKYYERKKKGLAVHHHNCKSLKCRSLADNAKFANLVSVATLHTNTINSTKFCTD